MLWSTYSFERCIAPSPHSSIHYRYVVCAATMSICVIKEGGGSGVFGAEAKVIHWCMKWCYSRFDATVKAYIYQIFGLRCLCVCANMYEIVRHVICAHVDHHLWNKQFRASRSQCVFSMRSTRTQTHTHTTRSIQSTGYDIALGCLVTLAQSNLRSRLKNKLKVK